MHVSSFVKAKVFVREYLDPMATGAGPVRVLEVGSKSYHEQDTYRSLFPAPRFAYSGLDIEAGQNVDIVPANPFVWAEIADNSFDGCVSGQTFEHNPYFWITFAEIARVLAPGGMALIVAPGAGKVHRYPVDCWRYYPDSWAALCALTGLDLVESYFETDDMASSVSGGPWRDSAVVARKPVMDATAAKAFHERLGLIVELFRRETLPVVQAPLTAGRWVNGYREEMQKTLPAAPVRALRKVFRARVPRVHTEGEG